MSENPYESPRVDSIRLAKHLISTTTYVKAFVANLFGSALGGAAAGLVLGGLVGAVLGGMGVDRSTIRFVSGAFGFLGGICVQFACFRFMVESFVLGELSSRHG